MLRVDNMLCCMLRQVHAGDVSSFTWSRLLRCIAFVVAFNLRNLGGRIVCAAALGERRQSCLHSPGGTSSL